MFVFWRVLSLWVNKETGLTPPQCCPCPNLGYVMPYIMIFFVFNCLGVRSDCSCCWYWWILLSSFHLSSPPVFSGFCVAWSLAFYVVFCSFVLFRSGHCVVCLWFIASDYPFGILDLRLLITTFGILDLRLLNTTFGILDLRLLITTFGILDLQLLITPLVS